MAQLVARTTPDRKVVRSNRAGLTIFFGFWFLLWGQFGVVWGDGIGSDKIRVSCFFRGLYLGDLLVG